MKPTRTVRRPSRGSLFEPLEPRQLLTGLPLPSALAGNPHFVLGDASNTLIGSFVAKDFTIPEDAVSNPALQLTIDWGDGSASPAILHRAGNKIQVWAGHAYDSLKTYHLSILASTDTVLPVRVWQKNVPVQLNADRGLTLNLNAGQAFNGTVSTVDRTAGLPKLTAPASSIDLPAGASFAQYTLGTTGATATFRIDWGDGQTSDATVISSGNAKYRVQGSHTYASPGSYRVVTYVVIKAADSSLLHMDMINSTAHVNAALLGQPGFLLPQHAPVTWSDLLPSGTTLNPNNTGLSGGSSGAFITGGNTAGILRLGQGTQSFSGSAAGSLTLSAGNVIISNTASSNGGILTIGGAGYVGSVMLNGTASGMLTLTGNGTLTTGSLNAVNTLYTGTLGHGAFNLQVPTATLTSGGLVFNNTSPGIILVNPLQGSGTLTNSATSNSLILTNPLELSGTITTGGTLISNGTVSILGVPVLTSTNNVANYTLHIAPGVTLAATDPILTAPWTLHANGTISLVVNSSTAQFDAASTPVILPQRHSGLITFLSDVPADILLSTLQLLPPDFNGTLTLPPDADLTILPPFSNATIVTLPLT